MMQWYVNTWEMMGKLGEACVGRVGAWEVLKKEEQDEGEKWQGKGKERRNKRKSRTEGEVKGRKWRVGQEGKEKETEKFFRMTLLLEIDILRITLFFGPC
jgi:hypothetical protein